MAGPMSEYEMLPAEIKDIIFGKMSAVDVARTKATSRTMYSSAKRYEQSPEGKAKAKLDTIRENNLDNALLSLSDVRSYREVDEIHKTSHFIPDEIQWKIYAHLLNISEDMISVKNYDYDRDQNIKWIRMHTLYEEESNEDGLEHHYFFICNNSTGKAVELDIGMVAYKPVGYDFYKTKPERISITFLTTGPAATSFNDLYIQVDGQKWVERTNLPVKITIKKRVMNYDTHARIQYLKKVHSCLLPQAFYHGADNADPPYIPRKGGREAILAKKYGKESAKKRCKCESYIRDRPWQHI